MMNIKDLTIKVFFTAGTLTAAIIVDLRRFHQHSFVANLFCDTMSVISSLERREEKKLECHDGKKPCSRGEI
ncbi:hypothetical protein Hanom_Chr05g00408151 [Helianthus anomalus]